jgi:hypothetical protein
MHTPTDLEGERTGLRRGLLAGLAAALSVWIAGGKATRNPPLKHSLRGSRPIKGFRGINAR